MLDAMTSRSVTVRGRVEDVYFSSPGFSAGCLRTEDGKRVKFAGPVLVQEHEPVVLRGRWETHPKYGRQLQVESVELDLDLDPEGLAHYLAHHPAIRGIGPARARRIALRFGADFERVLTDEPHLIADEARIPVEAVEALRDEWLRTKTVNAALVWLSTYGLTHHQVTTLVEKYGNNVVAILKADPYLIVREIPGFGFRRVDQIALQVGTPKEHPSRLRAGVLFCVRERLDQGDCWVGYEQLVEAANEVLALDSLGSRELIEHTLEGLISAGEFSCASYAGRFLVAIPEIRRMEEELGTVFSSGGEPNPHFAAGTEADALMQEHAPNLNAGQREAVRAALAHRMCLISGGAGSGKTYVSAAITTICRAHDLSVVLAAPTGKAAKRMEQVIGQEAFTLHRLLGYDGHTFALGPDDPLDTDVLIVDEVSMLDVPLAWQLFQAVDPTRTAVVLVGDHNQLPPVGPGNILRDLIDTRVLPTVVLDEIVRQAGALKENSIAVLHGEVRKTATPEPAKVPPWILINHLTQADEALRVLLDMHRDGIAERLHFDLVSEVQVLTPTHKGPLGTAALNTELQRLVQHKLYGVEVPPPRPGRRPRFLLHDKVIQKRNNYSLGIMNGSIGQVAEVGANGRDLVVRFFDREVREVELLADEGHLQDLHLAYALTIHSAQGSEFPCVVLVVHKSHSFQHHRNLFYTGVTRAQQVAIILGDQWGIRNCADKREVGRRKTFLSLVGQQDGSHE
ncbi:MAG: AAA family ATPase [Armatimonadota bacterium]